MKRKTKIINKKVVMDLELLLKQIPEANLYHLEHGLRPPIGIFNVSFRKVVLAFQRVLSDIESFVSYDNEVFTYNNLLSPLKENLQRESNQEEIENINAQIKEYEDILDAISNKQSTQNNTLLGNINDLLDSLMAFIDDTYHIMKTLYRANAITKPPLFADKWMEKAEKKIVNDYKDKIKEYRDHLAPIVNIIKHNHGRLNTIRFTTEYGTIIGYYLEGIDSQGVLGSDRTIHKLFRNEDTAFSLNRDLKFHLSNFIFICHHLKMALQKVLKEKHNFEIDHNFNADSLGSEDLLNVALKVQHLPNLFFYDEFYKPVPEVTLSENDVEFVYPSTNSKLVVYNKTQIRSSMTGDGVTKSFRPPYWSPKK